MDNEKYNPYDDIVYETPQADSLSQTELVNVINTSEQNKIISGIRNAATRAALVLLVFTFGSDLIVRGITEIYEKYGLVDDIFYVNLFYVIAYFVQYIVVVPIALIIGNFRQTHRVKTYFRKPKVSFKDFFKFTAMTYAIGTTVNLITALVYIASYNLGHQNTDLNEEIVSQMTFSPVVSMAIMIASVILAPLFEELVFRGSLQTHLKNYGAAFAIVTTGIVFGLVHGNFHQIPYAMTFGFCLGYIAYKTKSIIPSIMVHFFINGFSMLMLYANSQLDIVKLEEMMNNQDLDGIVKVLGENPLILIIFLLCEITAVVVFTIGMVNFILTLKNDKKSFNVPKGTTAISEKKKYLTYFTSPLMLLVIAYLLYKAIMYEIPIPPSK
ncbi:MAG: CPBP family intramembrane metalloprotease [Ruminococcus sp.]|jgi:membrane protease YdiL (CAAX protease family)|nr:CPBP family intramembrane metalloprotease [Ruminococcus sp.]